uniref:Uncharacterized protein n=1 Tax=uncultured marine virus TaxID=186617 RepID=A0A0F7L3U7_9VIRU|nr:hypothetical protein [uncultured marine virus]
MPFFVAPESVVCLRLSLIAPSSPAGCLYPHDSAPTAVRTHCYLDFFPSVFGSERFAISCSIICKFWRVCARFIPRS